jgi:hypothetical protein
MHHLIGPQRELDQVEAEHRSGGGSSPDSHV